LVFVPGAEILKGHGDGLMVSAGYVMIALRKKRKRMSSFDYECDGQITLTEYIESVAPPDYCDDCVLLEGYHCRLHEKCEGKHSVNKSDGWKRIKHHKNNTVSGEFPECMEWKEVITFCYFKVSDEFKFLPAQGKDKTFKWTKEFSNPRDPGIVYAWRYKE